ncbi:hypothetical protein [uncultured Amphritea sp.]|uniref:phage tail tip fiber protein n=1 Tax=uncultured Amphritea sp. TaxID=981605 RepID=UPI002609FF04|nr:hypothetical protein [uncultured Amphritea sp.]
MSSTKGLPSVITQDRSIRQFLDAVKEITEVGEGVRGDPLDRKLTLRDLVQSGVVTLSAAAPSPTRKNTYIPPTAISPAYPQNTSTPPQPINLTAVAVPAKIIIQWDNPYEIYSNHSHTNIYRSDEDNFSNAVLISNSNSFIYADDTGYTEVDGIAKGYYYWITFVSSSSPGIEGPVNSANGVYQIPTSDSDFYLDKLTGLVTDSQLHADLSSRIDLIDADQNTAGSVAYQVAAEAQERADAIAQEASDRVNGLAAEQVARANAVAIEASDRAAAISAEAMARVNAITQEISDRNSAITGAVAAEALARGAAIQSEQTARVDGDAAIAESVTALAATVNHPSTGVAATASGLSETLIRVSAVEGQSSSQSSQITSLQAAINSLSISPFDANFTYDIGNKFIYNSEIYSVSATQTTPNVTPPNASFYNLEGDYSTIEDAVSANSAAVASLDSSVTSLGNTAAAQATQIINLQSGLINAQDATAANSGAISVLDSRVTLTESGTAANSESVTALNSAVSNKADSSAVNALTTRVEETETAIVSQSDAATVLSSKVGELISMGEDPTFKAGGAYWADWAFSGRDLDGSDLPIVGNGIAITGTKWMFSRNAIRIDTSRKYRVRLKVKQTVDSSITNTMRVYAGVATLNENYGYITGGAGSHRYCAVAGTLINVSMGEQVFEGTISGEGIEHSEFRPGTVYVRPMFIVNYNNGDGTCEVSEMEITDITGEVATAEAVTAITTRVEATEAGLLAQSQEITDLGSTVANKADTSALNSLSTEVNDRIDGEITARGDAVTALGNSLTTAINQKADSTTVALLDSEVNSRIDGEITARGAAVTALENSLTAAINQKADSSTVSQLDSEVNSRIDGEISARGAAITALNNALTSAIGQKADSSTVALLDSEVNTRIDGEITARGAAVLALQNNIDDKADSSALNVLSSTVSDIDGVVTAQSSDITKLQDSIKIGNNLLDMTAWKVGNTGAAVGVNGGTFSLNGLTEENSIVSDTGPGGVTQPVWLCSPAPAGATDGGWNYTGIPIDHTLAYRVTVWVRKVHATDGSTYLGSDKFGPTSELNGNVATNPYFVSGDVPEADKWYLMVGILHGSGYAGADTGMSGIYDPDTGLKVVNGTEFKNSVGATTQTHRAYLFYTTNAANTQSFARPRFEVLDETAPTIESLITNMASLEVMANTTESLINSVSTIDGVVSSHSSQLTQLTTTSDGHTAAIQQQLQSIDGINAQWTIKTDVNGRVAGTGLMNDGATSIFEIIADAFSVLDPDDLTTVVLGTLNGVPIIDGAYMKTASIESAAIKELTVDKITGDKAAFVNANIADGSITNAKIGNVIQSDNYDANNGWQINKLGQAFLRDAYVKGTIEGSRIVGSIIDGGVFIGGTDLTVPTIADNGTFPRYLCYASGVSYMNSVTNTSGSPFSVASDIKSADYEGEGTTDYAGYAAYANFNRYPVFGVRPTVLITMGGVSSDTSTNSGLEGVVNFTVSIKVDGVAVATITKVSNFGRIMDFTQKTIGLNEQGFSGSITATADFVTDYSSETVVHTAILYDVVLSLTPTVDVTYSGDGDLSVTVDCYKYAGDAAHAVHGGTLTISDDATSYL